MSAYLLDRKHFVAIAAFLASAPNADDRKVFFHQADRPYEQNYYDGVRLANVLMQANVDSVNCKYGAGTEKAHRQINARDLSTTPPSIGQLSGLLRSLAYQSCEPEGWYTSEAFYLIGVLRENALERVAMAEQALDPNPEGKTYSWA